MLDNSQNSVVLLCFGTRPEWLKIKPLTKVLTDYKLLFTGQHTDLLRDIDVDYKIDILGSDNRLDSVVADCMLQFPEGEFDTVLVQGDTASAFACALAAFHRRLRLVHLEAGLRTEDLDNPYPEEGYRQMISRIADVNLCPTTLSVTNLVHERTVGQKFVVGNTVLDNLLPYKEKCEYTSTVLITMHRRENHACMSEWFTAINDIAKEHPNLNFVFPIHPNPNVQKHKNLLTNVNVIEPLGYNELLNMLVKCKFVITDSGGLQEEGSFFNKRVIVCRKTTERPEGISTGHSIMCLSPKELKNIVQTVNEDYIIKEECPYGDGKSAQRIEEILG